MKKILTILFLSSGSVISAQELLVDTVVTIQQPGASRLYSSSATMLAGYCSNDVVPFWMRANKYGNIPVSGASGSSILSFEKVYDEALKKSKVDWGFGLEGRLNVGTTAEFRLIESYAKVRWGAFQLKGGRSKDIMGLADSTIGMGAFAMSGNAMGVPKLELSFPEYWSIPFLANLFAVKGNFSIGWLGDTRISSAKDSLGGIDHRKPGVTKVKSLLHQKSLYVRFGKMNWPVQLFGGFNHHTVFGNEKEIYADFSLSRIESIYYAVAGKTWHSSNGFNTKLGNQLGSIDVAMNVKVKSYVMYAYHQFFYDVGALAHLANVKDGLTGLSFTSNKRFSSGIHFQKILFEFLYSKDQAGGIKARVTPSGDEDYYNNYLYSNGWSYNNLAIGNPFFTPRHEAVKGLPYLNSQYFINNRIIGLHGATQWQFGATHAIAKLSYTKNYGTYGTSAEGASTGNRRYVAAPPYFPELKQMSASLELHRSITNKWSATVALAVDKGELLPNSFGASVGIKRTLMPKN